MKQITMDWETYEKESESREQRGARMVLVAIESSIKSGDRESNRPPWLCSLGKSWWNDVMERLNIPQKLESE